MQTASSMWGRIGGVAGNIRTNVSQLAKDVLEGDEGSPSQVCQHMLHFSAHLAHLAAGSSTLKPRGNQVIVFLQHCRLWSIHQTAKTSNKNFCSNQGEPHSNGLIFSLQHTVAAHVFSTQHGRINPFSKYLSCCSPQQAPGQVPSQLCLFPARLLCAQTQRLRRKLQLVQ